MNSRSNHSTGNDDYANAGTIRQQQSTDGTNVKANVGSNEPIYQDTYTDISADDSDNGGHNPATARIKETSNQKV